MLQEVLKERREKGKGERGGSEGRERWTGRVRNEGGKGGKD